MLIKELLFGYYDTQCLFTVTKLNIADYLKDGEKSINELAQLTQTDEKKLYRIMRYMAAKKVFDELPNKIFQLNGASQYLVASNQGSIKHFVQLHAHYFYQAAAELSSSIENDKSAFELKFGKIADSYLKENAAASQIYNTAQRENSELVGKLIVGIYDFSSYKTIVDVGGGIGSLLTAILLKNKNSHGINYDLPALQKTAEAYFKENHVAERCQYVGGDFFKSVPSGGDLYILKAILHGKSDDDVIKVLNHCKEALPSQGKILLIERLINKAEKNFVDACVNDINMLTVTNGSVRSVEEFEVLIEKSGLAITKIYPVQDALAIIEIQIKTGSR